MTSQSIRASPYLQILRTTTNVNRDTNLGIEKRTLRQTINLLLPSDVTGMLNEVKLPGQLREQMQQSYFQILQIMPCAIHICHSTR
jgi:hypothetical protein